MQDRSKPTGRQGSADVYSVSQLNREARELLESGLPRLWVEGEISNLARPASGHIYFSLKDQSAQISCAMFRAANRQLNFRPENGTQVLLRGRVSIYEPRGSYQLIVDVMEEAGEGLLRRKFEELKRRLRDEGLFEPEHKKMLPAIPTTIGVVTSPTGAAIRDIIHVLARRYPAANVIVYPTRVQGEDAHREIAHAIELADERHECDVLVVARGGGSLEDLWSFNEEVVARAIYACSLPVISGVGHEIDLTIADLVADVRAPTPSGAAELITPDGFEMQRSLQSISRRIGRATQRLLTSRMQQQQVLLARMQRSHPGAVLRQMQQKVDELNRQLCGEMHTRLLNRQITCQRLAHRLINAAPRVRLQANLHRLGNLRLRLGNAMEQQLHYAGARLSRVAGELAAVSPLATLERGYAVVRNMETGTVLTNVHQVHTGDPLELQLARGLIEAKVVKTRAK